MDILKTIVEERREDARAASRRISASSLREQAKSLRSGRRSLSSAIRARSGTFIIAEMKKASPSAGLLCKDYRPAGRAREYASAGAGAISVLTEPHHFQGSVEHLREARAAVSLPVLMKDFLCDPYHICEAAACGADAILLIVAALDRGELRDLHDEAVGLGMEVLAEAHSQEELDAAAGLETALIGVNSRDLRTLSTDLRVAERLAAAIPPDRIAVAESGLRSRADIERLEAQGYDAFLVGEALMKAGDPRARLRELIGQAQP